MSNATIVCIRCGVSAPKVYGNGSLCRPCKSVRIALYKLGQVTPGRQVIDVDLSARALRLPMARIAEVCK